MASSFAPFTLSPFDHQFADAYISFLISFAPKEPSSCAAILESAARSLVERFPFLAGEIVTHPHLDGKDNVARIQPIQSNTDPIQLLRFRHFDASIASVPLLSQGSVRNGLESVYHNQALCPLPVMIPPDQRRPPVAFQANIFTDGVVLGVNFTHLVFDATGVGKILEALAEYCNSPAVTCTPSKPDHPKRITAIFMNPPDPNSTASLPGGIDYLQGPLGVPREQIPLEQTFAAPSSLSTRRLTFSAANVLRLQEECNRLLQSQGSPDKPPSVSRNDVLSCLLGLCIQKVRGKTAQPGTKQDPLELAIGVNMRPRLASSIAADYMGNMAMPLILTTDINHAALDTPQPNLPLLTQLALRMREKLQSYESRFFNRVMSLARKQSDWSRSQIRFTKTTVTSWRHLNIYSLDFGAALGPVTNFDTPFAFFGGWSVVLPRYSSEGEKEARWDVDLTLESDLLELLVEDDWLSGVLEL
ncbi:hypothetical protein MW887_000367 [Aspergillus wentii]|nr:hypothetical protein MW887_000367 [Aspergillus wentii]